MRSRSGWKIRLSASEYLSQYLAPSSRNECWEWLGARDHAGYGRCDGVKSIKELGFSVAHRLAWHCLVGPIPEGLKVLHKCDNRSCCNPEHLFLGTQADNMKDMAAKGRSIKGRIMRSRSAAD